MRHRIMGWAALTLIVTQAAWAQDEYSEVEERIRAMAPNAKNIAVSETPIEGMLMVQVGSEILYATADGKYLFQGRVLDMETRRDLTESAKAGMRQEIMADFDQSRMIAFSPVDPQHELTVFTDIDCGYCRKLHAQMDQYNEQGISIRYMAFPRAGIGSRSYEKAVSVWCAEDQQAAMTTAKSGGEPKPQQCDNPIAEQYQQGMELGVTGTPAILTASGQLIPGYVPPDQLRVRLDRMAETEVAE